MPVFVYNADDLTQAKGCDTVNRWTHARVAEESVRPDRLRRPQGVPRLRIVPGHIGYRRLASVRAREREIRTSQLRPVMGRTRSRPATGSRARRTVTAPFSRAIGPHGSQVSRACRRRAREWQLITTFNEWGEGTAIESASGCRNSAPDGTYCDWSGTAPSDFAADLHAVPPTYMKTAGAFVRAPECRPVGSGAISRGSRTSNGSAGPPPPTPHRRQPSPRHAPQHLSRHSIAPACKAPRVHDPSDNRPRNYSGAISGAPSTVSSREMTCIAALINARCANAWERVPEVPAAHGVDLFRVQTERAREGQELLAQPASTRTCSPISTSADTSQNEQIVKVPSSPVMPSSVSSTR